MNKEDYQSVVKHLYIFVDKIPKEEQNLSWLIFDNQSVSPLFLLNEVSNKTEQGIKFAETILNRAIDHILNINFNLKTHC